MTGMADGCVNWPEITGDYKFVQLYVGGKPFLRFGDAGIPHGKILAQCLDSLEISYKLTGSSLARIEIPEVRASDMRL
jgi:hypothetical protein